MFITAGERSYLRVVFELILLALVVFALGSLLTNARPKRSAPKPVPDAARETPDRRAGDARQGVVTWQIRRTA